MTNHDFGNPAYESGLMNRAQLMLTVTGIRVAGDWDPAAATKEQIKLLALDAVDDERLMLSLDDASEPVYSSWLTDMESPADDPRRGRLSLRYKEHTFNGIDVDLTPFGKGFFHLYPTGNLTKLNGAKETSVHPVHGRILYQRMRRYCPTFTDPLLLAQYLAQNSGKEQ